LSTLAGKLVDEGLGRIITSDEPSIEKLLHHSRGVFTRQTYGVCQLPGVLLALGEQTDDLQLRLIKQDF